jgi:phosphoribosylanthranilate isomerase
VPADISFGRRPAWNQSVFTIKICGIRRAEDLPHIAAAGADAVGLNFYPKSKRYLAAGEAAGVVAAVPQGIARVGVFVNASSADMLLAAEQCHLDYLQLHGDEPPEQLVELGKRRVIKAFRFSSAGWTPIERYLTECERYGTSPAAVMIDAPAPRGAYGGTGTTADWHAITNWRSHIDLPLILAGGLTAANVAEVIRLVRPTAIDVASGVEGPDGFKDPALVLAFGKTARAVL